MRAERKVVEFTKSGKPVRHGFAVSYRTHGCRCLPCTEASTKLMSESRKRAISRDEVPDEVHGKPHGYVYYKCKCGECMEANREAGRRGYHRRKDRSA